MRYLRKVAKGDESDLTPDPEGHYAEYNTPRRPCGPCLLGACGLRRCHRSPPKNFVIEH